MNPSFVIYLVAFAAFLGPFTQTIYAPVLPELAAALHTSDLLINLSISIFTLFLAVMQVVYGPIVDQRGRKKVLLVGIAIYIAASLGCFLSDSIAVLLVFRALQAIGIAAGSVVAVTVIGDLFSGARRGRAMGTFQMMVSLGPVVGPVVGGFVGGHFDYHYVFVVLALIGGVIFIFNLMFLDETQPEAGQGGFQFGTYATVVRSRLGSAVVMLGFIQYYTFYNFLVFLPDILTVRYDLPAEQKGLVFLPLSVCVIVGSFLGGRAQEKVPPRRLLLLTSALNVASIVGFIVVAKLSLTLLIVAIALFGLFLGLSLPVQTTLLTEAFKANRATAVGVYNFFRFIGMACGPLVGTLLYGMGGIVMLYGFAAALFALAIVHAQRKFAALAPDVVET